GRISFVCSLHIIVSNISFTSSEVGFTASMAPEASTNTIAPPSLVMPYLVQTLYLLSKSTRLVDHGNFSRSNNAFSASVFRISLATLMMSNPLSLNASYTGTIVRVCPIQGPHQDAQKLSNVAFGARRVSASTRLPSRSSAWKLTYCLPCSNWYLPFRYAPIISV